MMAISESEPPRGYILAQQPSATERARLEGTQAQHDAFTTAALTHLGVSAGWRCWEVGAGAGSIARWLAERVGADGHVLATDVDLRFLHPVGHPRLEVQRHDVTTDAVPTAEFDLIHARLLLGWLSAREVVLERLVGALRPGGWLLVEDFDGFSMEAVPPSDVLARLEAALEALMVHVGFETHFGGRALAVFRRLGLVEVGAIGGYHVLYGGAPLMTTSVRPTVEAFGPRLVQAGLLSAHELEAALALFDDAGRLFHSARLVSTRGRRTG